jgi:nitroreductase
MKGKEITMNEVLKNILTRRSCRSYTDQKIKAEDLEQILQAGIYAPSAMNRQTWQFTVVRKKENILELAEVVRKALERPEGYNFYNPDLIVLVSNEKENSNGLADASCAMENMFLMANELGISSCWINQLKGICDMPQVRTELRKLQIPDNHVVWGIAVMGYAKEPAKEAVKNNKVIVYAD